MEILQKLTLYDLLGYALPGGVLLMVYGQENLDVLFDEGAKGWILLLLFGFWLELLFQRLCSGWSGAC